MAAASLQELFIDELRDMYDGEKRIVRALPKMAKAATTPELQTAFMSHLKETERQVTRLEQVFRSLGEKVRGKKCDGIMGIVEENASAMEELEGAVLDAALIAGAQKVEHYEISSYGTLAYFAELLGESTAKQLLGETLNEERAADEKLSMIAKSKVNRQALMAESESDDEPLGTMRAGRRGTEARVVAHDRPSQRTAGRKTARKRSAGRSSKRSRGGRR